MKRAQRKALLKQARQARERSKPRPVEIAPPPTTSLPVARREPKPVAVNGPLGAIFSYMSELGIRPVIVVGNRDEEKPADVIGVPRELP